MNDIRTFSLSQLEQLVNELGHPKFRAKQLQQWLLKHRVSSYEEMSNIPKTLRESLALTHPLYQTQIIDRQLSADGTRKYVLRLHDGALIETVGLPSLSEGIEKAEIVERTRGAEEARGFRDAWKARGFREAERAGGTARAERIERAASSANAERTERTAGFAKSACLNDSDAPGSLSVCVSSQVGCAMECVFCATGGEGFCRNLSAGEIVEQLITVERDFARRISHVVVMGQGEPFLNYCEVIKALRIINSKDSFGIGARHITLSTCGIVDGIRQLSREPEQFTLAISLHSAIQETRDLLMPRMGHQPLPLLKSALLDYVRKTNRRVSLEYLLIDGVNDGEESLAELLRFTDGLLCHVNILPVNPVPHSPYQPSPERRTHHWIKKLGEHGVNATTRKSRGSDISGACGQLKNNVSGESNS